ncbi:MAG: Na/Pi cotransporter family protein [Patescibacteria group bacterium]
MDNSLLNLGGFLIGGLAIFLLGMNFTSDGLQKLAGASMKNVMTRLTHNRVIGAITGAGMTAVVQSSSFVSVMVVGFASARLLNLSQAASLIVGINVGATITAQIIAFQVAVLSMPLIALGVCLYLFAKKEGWHFSGQVLFGLGMLFLGLEYMKDAFAPLKDNPAFYEFFITYGDNIFLALIVGIITTMIIQASSAIIGISIALAASGMIGFAGAVAIVLGSNIGTTLTAQIAALKMNRTAKRAALFHTVFNVTGVVWIMLFFGVFLRFVDAVTPNEADPEHIARHIANAHTIFNVLNMVVFLLVLPYLVRLVEIILPRGKYHKLKGLYPLHTAYLKAPDIALMQVKLACIEMLELSRDNFKKYSQKNEDIINENRKNISKYLGKISRTDLTEIQSQKVPVLLHIVNDIEAIADEIKGLADVKLDKRLESISSELDGYLKDLIGLLNNPVRNKVIKLEENLIEFRLKRLDNIKYQGDVVHSLHDLTRRVANIAVSSREV